MLFCKLLLSPLPHARVRSMDLSEALAMPGVSAILTADDMPARRAAAAGRERGLTNEPHYQGDPMLAVAAVDELTAADAIERIRIQLGAAAVRLRSARQPAAQRPERAREKATFGSRATAAAWCSWRAAKGRGAGRFRAVDQDAQVERAGVRRRRRRPVADGRGARAVGSTATSRPDSKRRRSSSTRRSSSSRRRTRRWSRAAPWPTGATASSLSTRPTQSTIRTVAGVATACGIEPDDVV